jgi:hypothetical protein
VAHGGLIQSISFSSIPQKETQRMGNKREKNGGVPSKREMPFRKSRRFDGEGVKLQIKD